jgi:hypothetical protein
MKIYKFLTERPEGRTLVRGLKTFVYACLSFYVVNRVAPFTVDYLAMLEVGLLASLGFTVDKGFREYKNK